MCKLPTHFGEEPIFCSCQHLLYGGSVVESRGTPVRKSLFERLYGGPLMIG